MLRYEALSLAVSQLHTQSQQLHQSSQSLASVQGQGVPAETQQQQQPPYTVGTGRDSPSHLLASRQPKKAHEPMFGAAQPGTEPAQGPATAALLQVIAHCPLAHILQGRHAHIRSTAACQTLDGHTEVSHDAAKGQRCQSLPGRVCFRQACSALACCHLSFMGRSLCANLLILQMFMPSANDDSVTQCASYITGSHA